MAAEKRNETEREADRLLLLKLRMGGGVDMDHATMTALLNSQRSVLARDVTIAMGGTEEEAAEAAERAQLSRQTVSRDLRIIDERIRNGQEAAGALWLDEQIEDVKAEIQALHKMDEEVREEIQLARAETLVHSRGVLGEGKKVTIEGLDRRHKEIGSAPPAFYQVLGKNALIRQKLRAELRMLRYGSLWFRTHKAEAEFTANLEALDDPDRAPEAAKALYEHEVEALKRAQRVELIPLSPEFAQAERVRLGHLRERTGRMQRLLAANRPARGPNAQGGDVRAPYELIIKRVSPIQDDEEDGDDE